MNNTNLPTIIAFKQEAKEYRKQSTTKLTHAQALDKVANKYGYKDYRTIKNKLPLDEGDIADFNISNVIDKELFDLLGLEDQMRLLNNIDAKMTRYEIIIDPKQPFVNIIDITNKEFDFMKFINELVVEEKINYVFFDFGANDNIHNFGKYNSKLRKLGISIGTKISPDFYYNGQCKDNNVIVKILEDNKRTLKLLERNDTKKFIETGVRELKEWQIINNHNSRDFANFIKELEQKDSLRKNTHKDTNSIPGSGMSYFLEESHNFPKIESINGIPTLLEQEYK